MLKCSANIYHNECSKIKHDGRRVETLSALISNRDMLPILNRDMLDMISSVCGESVYNRHLEYSTIWNEMEINKSSETDCFNLHPSENHYF